MNIKSLPTTGTGCAILGLMTSVGAGFSSADLVAHLPMDENSGVVIDDAVDSVNPPDGNFVNFVDQIGGAPGPNMGWAPGIIGSGLETNGAQPAFAQRDAGGGLPPVGLPSGNSARTMLVWANTDANGLTRPVDEDTPGNPSSPTYGQGDIFAAYGSPRGAKFFGIGNSYVNGSATKLQFYGWGGIGDYTASIDVAPLDTWALYFATYDGTTVNIGRLFDNAGSLDFASDSAARNLDTLGFNVQTLAVSGQGQVNDGDRRTHDGTTDDLSIWDEVLTAGEIKGAWAAALDLAYDAGAMALLFDVHDEVSVSELLADGKTWYRGTGLTGSEGEVQFDGVDYTIVLDEVAGTGVTTFIPEPASLALLAAGGLLTLSRRRSA